MNEWEQQQPVDMPETSPTDPDISFKHIGLLAGIILVPLIIIGVVLPFIPKQKTPQIRIADSSVLLPSPSPISTIAIAVLASVTGDVQVKKGDIWAKAVPEDEIAQSDVIKTSFDSQATLLFGSGSIIRVDQNSQITLSEYSREDDSWIIRINQIFGRTWNRVQKLIGTSVYEVNTPTAVATVRGTSFGVDANASGSAITVDEGEVIAKIIDEKTPDRKVIREVRIQKQEVVEVLRKRVEARENIIARRVEKLPEWVEEHKREIEKEAPKIQEIRREIEQKIELRREEIKVYPSPTPFRTIDSEIKVYPTPTPITNFRLLTPEPTPVTKIETEKPLATPLTTSDAINTDSNFIR